VRRLGRRQAAMKPRRRGSPDARRTPAVGGRSLPSEVSSISSWDAQLQHSRIDREGARNALIWMRSCACVWSAAPSPHRLLRPWHGAAGLPESSQQPFGARRQPADPAHGAVARNPAPPTPAATSPHPAQGRQARCRVAVPSPGAGRGGRPASSRAASSATDASAGQLGDQAGDRQVRWWMWARSGATSSSSSATAR